MCLYFLHPYRVCRPHKNTVCDMYLSNAYVLVNTSDFTAESQVNETLALLNEFEANNTISKIFSECLELVKALVCHSVYPACDAVTLDTRKICNNTCDLFAFGGTCADVLDPFELPDTFQLMLDNCDTRVDPAGTSPECVPIPLDPEGSLLICEACTL